MKRFLFFTTILFYAHTSTAQIGIGTNTPDSSAQLDVYSTNRGLLLPRMTSAQRRAIVKPAIGLLVFDVTKNSLFMYDGAKWSPLAFSSEKDIIPYSRDLATSQVNDHLGFAVAIDRNYAVIGAPLDSIAGSGKQGAAYFFVNNGNGWEFQNKVTASDITPGNYFGSAVAIRGGYAVIGTFDTATAGSAYIFFRNNNTWTQQIKLTASDGAGADKFGSVVSITDDYIAIGAPGDDVNAVANMGSVYIYSRTGTDWGNEVKIIPADGRQNLQYGTSLSISGDKFLVGVPNDYLSIPPGTYYMGSVYPYKKNGNTWTLMNKLVEDQFIIGNQGYEYGTAVSISGDYAAIADYGSFVCVYKYADTGWKFESRVNTTNSYGYGKAVSISGDYLAVGAVGHLPPGTVRLGEVFCYKRNGTSWTLIKDITKGEATTSNYTLGRSVAIDGNTLELIIGAPGTFYGSEINQTVSEKGKVYFTNLE